MSMKAKLPTPPLGLDPLVERLQTEEGPRPAASHQAVALERERDLAARLRALGVSG